MKRPASAGFFDLWRQISILFGCGDMQPPIPTFAIGDDLKVQLRSQVTRDAEFNTERPHEALGMKCPAELYVSSTRRYDGLPELTYPFHDRDVLVTACGRLCLHRKRINISIVLAGQKLGIKEVDDGIWLTSFMHYDLGYFDLEQKTLQPPDNPFGTQLSPMS